MKVYSTTYIKIPLCLLLLPHEKLSFSFPSSSCKSRFKSLLAVIAVHPSIGPTYPEDLIASNRCCWMLLRRYFLLHQSLSLSFTVPRWDGALIFWDRVPHFLFAPCVAWAFITMRQYLASPSPPLPSPADSTPKFKVSSGHGRRQLATPSLSSLRHRGQKRSLILSYSRTQKKEQSSNIGNLG